MDDADDPSNQNIDGDAGTEILTPQNNTATLWKHTLERVVSSIAVLKMTHTKAFDTEAAGSSYATGFVVDKTLGIILTNRHVVSTGPVVAEAIFQNREEITVLPLYVDPVHDFAFLKFSPTALHFMETSEIPLAPEAAAVGLDVRVVGNDSGEKISILSGTLARLDRDAPRYGHNTYNDFNTFYLQAASGTKGGSSGSPVIDVHGRAVALNAGGKNKAASAYYLPLQRIVRALDRLRCSIRPDGTWEAPSIPRGDLQATFLFKGFDELKRLGLRQDTEACIRGNPLKEKQHNGEGTAAGVEGTPTGMLVLDKLVPGGPLDGIFQAGDILVRVNNTIVIDHLTMETILDDHSPTKPDAPGNNTVTIEMERGGSPILATVPIQDLHAVIPSAFLELGAGVVHSLSYHQARNNHSKVGSVYVAEAGYMMGKSGVPKHAIITAIDGKATPTMDLFVDAVKALPHGARVPLEYFTFDARTIKKRVILNVNWNWYGPPLWWERQPCRGQWISTSLVFQVAAAIRSGGKREAEHGTPIPRHHSVCGVAALDSLEKECPGVTSQEDDTRLIKSKHEQRPGELQQVNSSMTRTATATPSTTYWRKDLEARLRSALVILDFEVPLVALADGIHSRSFCGAGFVAYISDSIGYVIADRNTVSIAPGDITISFGGYPAEVNGKVCFLHPLHNFAIVSFDPAELEEEARQQIGVVDASSDPPLQRGDEVELVCLSNNSMRIFHRTSLVTNPAVPAAIALADVPRFRAVNEEIIKLDQDFGVQLTGVLADRQGCVKALWCSYSEHVNKEDREWTGGLAIGAILPWLEKLVAAHQSARLYNSSSMFLSPSVLVLDAELEPVLLSKAAQFGLPSEWIKKLMQRDPEKRHVLRVKSTAAQSDAKRVLRDGDMLLIMDGEVIVSFEDVERILLRRTDSSRLECAKDPCLVDGHGGKEDGVGKKRQLIDREGDVAGDEEPGKKRSRSNGIGKMEKKGSGTYVDPAPTAAAATECDTNVTATECDTNIIHLTIFRDGDVLNVSYQLGIEDGIGTRRLVHFAGAQIQPPHRAVKELGYFPEEYGDNAQGLYISRWHHGSPAHRYSLYALSWILEVNGKKTCNIDEFLAVVKDIPDGAAVRMKVMNIETMVSKVLTFKTDLRYWPTWELVLGDDGEWKRVLCNGCPLQREQGAD